MPLLLGLSFLISSLTYKFYFMEYLIRNLIEQLIIKKELELNYIEKYKNDGKVIKLRRMSLNHMSKYL